MQSWSSEALGQVVRDLRRERGLTQAEFGRRAGYQGGAGVSISRIENGQLEPGPERFEGLAAALDLTTGELAARAAAKSESLGVATGSNSESVMARRERLQQELDSRKELVTDLEQAFAEALDRAKRNFLIRIIEIAGRVYGASPSVPVRLLAGSTPHRDEAEAEAAYLIEFTRYGVEQALAETAGRGAAYETFTEAVARGTLLTIPAISELKGGLAVLGGFLAAARVRTPATRGTGTVGGLAILAVSAGGVFLVGQHRSRKQQQQLAAKLDVVEAEIAETEPSIDALRVLMSRATEILEYVAVHAAHALTRWEAQIGEGQLDMQSLSADEQQRYQDFVEIAAAQLAVGTIDFRELMTSRGSDLERVTALTDEILTQSRKAIAARV